MTIFLTLEGWGEHRPHHSRFCNCERKNNDDPLKEKRRFQSRITDLFRSVEEPSSKNPPREPSSCRTSSTLRPSIDAGAFDWEYMPPVCVPQSRPSRINTEGAKATTGPHQTRRVQHVQWVQRRAKTGALCGREPTRGHPCASRRVARAASTPRARKQRPARPPLDDGVSNMSNGSDVEPRPARSAAESLIDAAPDGATFRWPMRPIHAAVPRRASRIMPLRPSKHRPGSRVRERRSAASSGTAAARGGTFSRWAMRASWPPCRARRPSPRPPRTPELRPRPVVKILSNDTGGSPGAADQTPGAVERHAAPSRRPLPLLGTSAHAPARRGHSRH